MSAEPTTYVTEAEFTKWRHNLTGFFETTVDKAMTSLRIDMNERFGAIEEDLEDLFARVGVIETRLDTIEALLKLVLQALGVPIPPELGGEKAQQ